MSTSTDLSINDGEVDIAAPVRHQRERSVEVSTNGASMSTSTDLSINDGEVDIAASVRS